MAIAIILAIAVIGAVVLVVAGIRSPEAKNSIQDRLATYTERQGDEVVTLEEIELSERFQERILIPTLNRIGKLAARFTPQATSESTKKKLETAGLQVDPSSFLSLRFVLAGLFGGSILIVYLVTGRNFLQGLGLSVLFAALGFFFPDLWLRSRVSRRQKGIFRAMPDALDLLTICVEAGLGFDSAMAKVHEKWENDLALEFGRVIQEIRLGKLRRDAMRDMADRLQVTELTSFVAAIIQSEQLGVSMAKVLRIQSDQMRVRRRQMAEEEAHKLPIKMIFPIALLIFPSIMIILLGPAAASLMGSALGGILGFSGG